MAVIGLHGGVQGLLRHLIFVGVLAVLGLSVAPMQVVWGAVDPPCDQPGWFSDGYQAKDHTIFWYAGDSGTGYYYLVSINADRDDHFLYLRSTDLCNWEMLPPVLDIRQWGAGAAQAIWAPYVWEENGLFYMAYTEVTADFTQRIGLAISNDPADSAAWQPQGIIFEPDHPGMVWEAGAWSDRRDPMLYKMDDSYYLYYTGQDVDGYIVGLATAKTPTGPWTDWGRVFAAEPGAPLESPALIKYANLFYLFYHQPGNGERFRVGAGPGGPWTEDGLLLPGWAHEVWQDTEGGWWTSYLTTYDVNISPLQWNERVLPPQPLIGKAIYYQSLPLILRERTAGVVTFED